jgi:beta-trans-bergamotene synthase
MGRKTIPLLLSQPVARWSLAALITAWTIGLIALWRPPIVASIVFAALGLRCLGGYLSSYEEKDDYLSYCWYGVSEVRYRLFNIQVLTIGSIVLASWK